MHVPAAVIWYRVLHFRLYVSIADNRFKVRSHPATPLIQSQFFYFFCYFIGVLGSLDLEPDMFYGP